jgi:hypothetical protein
MQKLTVPITKTFVSKFSKIIDAGLCSGLGQPKPGEMCVEAALCFARGWDHGDKPQCVHPVYREFAIRLNDARWSSNAARAKGMKRFAIAQLGTIDKFDSEQFATKMAMYVINVLVPRAFREVAKLEKLAKHSADLVVAAQAMEDSKDLKTGQEAAKKGKISTSAAAYAAAATAARDQYLSDFAEYAVQVSIEIGTPGSKFLYLVEEAV